MPIIWDRRCHYWREGDRGTVTQPYSGMRGTTTPGRQSAGDSHSPQVRDCTEPPSKRKVLLDNGTGKNKGCVKHATLVNSQCHTMPRDTSKHGDSHRTCDAGSQTYQRSESAGMGITPPSQKGTSSDDRNSQVILYCHRPAHRACPFDRSH